jgi:hypothetical protein
MTPEEIDTYVRVAMRKAFTLGQTYCQQADSDYPSQHRKSDNTYKHYQDYTTEVSSVLSALGER